MIKRFLLFLLLLTPLAACDGIESEADYPVGDAEMERKQSRGKITGEGLSLGGGGDDESAGNNPLGVNSFLWRATLDTLSFLPLASADPFGGVIITDWYEDPNARGERYKVNAIILDRRLRADGIRVSLFKQRLGPGGQWQDEETNPQDERKIEDSILTRARQLLVKQL